MVKRQKPILITEEGYNEKKIELDQLNEKRVKAVEELSWARDMGDRSENAAYKSARIKLSDIDRKVRYLESLLKRAQVVEKRSDGAVGIGSIATVQLDGREIVYTLVGGHESNLLAGKLSIFSPVGKALLGRRSGDRVSIQIPAGVLDITLLSVR